MVLRIIAWESVFSLKFEVISVWGHSMRMSIELIQSAGVKWIIRADKDKKIKFCCLQSKAAEPYMKICGVDREDVLRRFLFVEGPNSYYQGSAGNCFPLQNCTVVSIYCVMNDDALFASFAQLL